MDANLQAVAEICCVCKDAGIYCDGHVFRATGFPIEAALKVLVEKMGVPDVKAKNKIRDSQLMPNYLIDNNSVKLGCCEWWMKRSKEAWYVGVGLCSDDLGEFSDYYVERHPSHKKLVDPSCNSSIESELIFVRVAGQRDPPREEVHSAIEECRGAGIKVMVITGDYKSTAEAICLEIGLFHDGEHLRGKCFTGKEFMALSALQQTDILSKHGGKVFCHAEPRHKQEIVRMLKEMGEIVVMTGDGVNDAPALKLADIGIAIGITGTEVAKEASDMVPADDNFSTIVLAVGESDQFIT